MNNSVFRKTMENVRKHKNIKIVTGEKRRNYLVLEPDYYTKKFFTEKLLAAEMKKSQILITKPAYVGLLELELSKTVT